MESLAAIMVRKEGHLGRRARKRAIWGNGQLALISPYFLETRTIHHHLKVPSPRALIADKSCSMWPICEQPWQKIENGASNRESLAAITTRKEGHLGKWGLSNFYFTDSKGGISIIPLICIAYRLRVLYVWRQFPAHYPAIRRFLAPLDQAGGKSIPIPRTQNVYRMYRLFHIPP